MESKIKSSFIPQKPVVNATVTSKARYKSASMDVIMLLSIVALAVSGVLSIGVFLYKSLAVSDAEYKISQLQKARESFNPEFIKVLMKLSDRIRTAEGILKNHTAPSAIFSTLEASTLTGVRFVNLDYNQKNENIATFKLKGKASSVNSIALQSSTFGDSDIIKDPIFSDIDLIKDGVTFTVRGNIDLSKIRYSTILALSQLQTNNTGDFTINNNNPQDQSINNTNLPQNDSVDSNGGFGSFGPNNTQ